MTKKISKQFQKKTVNIKLADRIKHLIINIKSMKPRSLALIAGVSYLIIFFTAIFANFFVLESLKENPLVFI